MRTFIASLLVSTVALGGFSAAYAADAVDQIPEAPVAQNEPVRRLPTGRASTSAAPAPTTWAALATSTTRVLLAVRSIPVTTGRLARSFTVLKPTSAIPALTALLAAASGKNEVNGSIRGRIGYDLNPFLLYGTAGLAATKNKFSNAAGSDTDTSLGYTVGAGAETFVTNNITARVEYRYTNYADSDFNVGGANISRGYDEHSVKVGIGVEVLSRTSNTEKAGLQPGFFCLSDEPSSVLLWEVSRNCELTPCGEFLRDMFVLRFDHRHGVAAERHAQRWVVRVRQCDHRLREAEQGRRAAGGCGRQRIRASRRRASPGSRQSNSG